MTYIVYPQARIDDPESSHEGARKATARMGKHKAIVLDILLQHNWLDASMVASIALQRGWISLRQHDTVRRRVSDLEREGWLMRRSWYRGAPFTYIVVPDRVPLARTIAQNLRMQLGVSAPGEG